MKEPFDEMISSMTKGGFPKGGEIVFESSSSSSRTGGGPSGGSGGFTMSSSSSSSRTTGGTQQQQVEAKQPGMIKAENGHTNECAQYQAQAIQE